MMFVQSLRGISHNKIEDTKEKASRAGGHCVRQTRRQGDGLDRVSGALPITWSLDEITALLD